MEDDNQDGRCPFSFKSKRIIPQPVSEESTDGFIDKWPAHASSRLTSNTLVSMTREQRLKVTTKKSYAPDYFKPKFLRYLENHVSKELHSRNILKEGLSLERLQVYRETFDYMIEAFNSYRPILAAIKKEYELMLQQYADKVRILEPMKEKLYVFAAECDRKIIEVREEEARVYDKLRKQNSELKEEVADVLRQNEDLKYQIERIKLETEEVYRQFREERDARRTLLVADKMVDAIISYPEIQSTTAELKRLRIGLTEAKKAHDVALRRIAELEAVYCDVVPRSELNRSQLLVKEMKQATDGLKHELRNMTNAKKDAEQRYEMAIEERNEFYLKFMQKNLGQTPEWLICAEFVSYMMTKWTKDKTQDKKYVELISMVVDDLLKSGISKEFKEEEEEEDDSKWDKEVEELKLALSPEELQNARLLAELIVASLTADEQHHPFPIKS